MTLPFTRAGVALTLVNWAAILGLQASIHPRNWPQMAAELALVPVMLACLWTSNRPGFEAWPTPLIMATNAFSGLLVVWLGVEPTLRVDMSNAGAYIVGFFGFTIFRLRPIHAASAVSTYFLLLLAVIRYAHLVGQLDDTMFSWYLAGDVVAFTSGLAACLLIDRLSRDGHVQELVIAAQQGAIEQERSRADRLLTSIFPSSIAEQLKKAPQMIAAHHPNVTVLFADIVGFTPMAAALSAEQLVQKLNEIFTSFDELAARLGAEKIKTIGDSYMAVVGAPETRADHAVVIAELALGMLGVLRELPGSHPISIRIGVNSGPAVAGVIGSRKFAYDLWGDTVNTAARMESHGVPGGIHVTEATRAQLEGKYVFEDRGVVEIKGKGPMRTWLLIGRSG